MGDAAAHVKVGLHSVSKPRAHRGILQSVLSHESRPEASAKQVSVSSTVNDGTAVLDGAGVHCGHGHVHVNWVANRAVGPCTRVHSSQIDPHRLQKLSLVAP